MPLGDTDTFTADVMSQPDQSDPSMSEAYSGPDSTPKSKDIGVAQPTSSPRQRGFDQPTLDRAYHTIDFLQRNPQWLANPYTQHAANALLAGSSRMIEMSIQLERVSSQAETVKLRNELGRKAVSDLSEVSKYIPDTDKDGQGQLGRLSHMLNSPDANMGDIMGEIAILKSKYKAPEKASRAEFIQLNDRIEKLESDPNSDPDELRALKDRRERLSETGDVKLEHQKKLAEFKESITTTDLAKILRERAAAKPEERPFYDSKLKAMEEKMGFAIQFDDQGRPIINYGPTSDIGKTTVATQTLAQRKLLRYEVATELMNHIQKNLETGHVGVAGVLGEMVGDRLLPQLGVDTFSGKRVDVRTALVTLRESLMREISDDPRFSIPDREEISKALPSSGVLESVQDARQRIETVRRIVAQRAGTYASGMGLPAPLWSLTPEQIRDRFNLPANDPRKITEQQAADALRRFHGFE